MSPSAREAQGAEAVPTVSEGKVRDECDHGSLRRQCRICELEAEVARLTEERDKARSAWSDLRDEMTYAEIHLAEVCRQAQDDLRLRKAAESSLTSLRQSCEGLVTQWRQRAASERANGLTSGAAFPGARKAIGNGISAVYDANADRLSSLLLALSRSESRPVDQTEQKDDTRVDGLS